MISAEEPNDRRRQAVTNRAASASGLAAFTKPARPALRTTDRAPPVASEGDGKSEPKVFARMMISPAATAALAAALSEQAAAKKLQHAKGSPAATSTMSAHFPREALPSSPPASFHKLNTASSTLPGPIHPKLQKVSKQEPSTTEVPSSTDPTSPTLKPMKPPKLSDSSILNQHTNDISSKPLKPAKIGLSSSISADEKPVKPPKSFQSENSDSSSSSSPSSSSSSSTSSSSVPPPPPVASSSASSRTSCSSPSSASSGKPARPKRITDEESSTPKGSEEGGNGTKPRTPRSKLKATEEEEDYSTCSSNSAGSRNSNSHFDSRASLNKDEAMNTLSRLEPLEGTSVESLAEDAEEEDDSTLLNLDTTQPNKYGVTVMSGKALKLLGVNSPSGAVSRLGTKSPNAKRDLISIAADTGTGNYNLIHYTSKALSVFTDYDFKNEEHQILSAMRMGKASAVCAALLGCSVDQFCKLIPVVACAIAETPGWATEVGDSLVAAIKQRIAASPAINQAVHFLKVSQLLSYPWAYNNWLSNLQTSSYLLEVCELLATREVGYEFKVPEGKKLFHPFQAGFTITSWQVTKIFNSNAKPRLVIPSGQLDERVSPTNGLVSVCGNPMIIKYGDDIRQDVAVLHIMCMMNNLWANANLIHEGCPVKSLAYGCLALSDTIGCIEFVPNALPLRLVSQAGRYSNTAINRMITSGAGSFVAAYILGVRDRHFDNILVSKSDGALFHIDFGRILGDQTTIDTGAFAITPDLKDVITSLGEDRWEVFVQLCLIAYKTIRDNNRLIISFTAMLMAPFQSQETVRNFIAQRLRLQLEDEVAMAKIRKKVSTAPTRWKTKFKNVVHGIATGD